MKRIKKHRIALPEGVEFKEANVIGSNLEIILQEELYADVSGIFRKPEPLKGGSDVYQKDNLPYWYCKIKDDRDEFMYLYFGDLKESDLLYDKSGNERTFNSLEEHLFKTNVLKAIDNMPIEGFRWFPVYEPSLDSRGNLQYVAGEDPLTHLHYTQWPILLENYSPENGSCISSKTTCFLLFLRLLKDGFATVHQLAVDSTSIGHYSNSKAAKQRIEKTGTRQLAGLYGLVGNTLKIVKDQNSDSGHSLIGGCYTDDGDAYPIASVDADTFTCFGGQEYYYPDSVGLIELTGPKKI